MDVIIRGIDKDLYRRMKAEAALRGYKISRAVEEAVRKWLQSESRQIHSDSDANNEAFHRQKRELLRKHRGRYVVFCRGTFVGFTETFAQAGELVRRAGAQKALVTKLGEEEPVGGEWLWGSIALQTA